MKSERELNIFSISFLDVFGCALGAMILIFILNSQALSNSVKSAVEKYRDKAKQAQRDRAQAISARQNARNARDDAQQARDLARRARDQAEQAEQIAKQHRKDAVDAWQEAMKQKDLAQKNAEEANNAKQKLLQMIAQTRLAKMRLQKKRRQLEEEIGELTKTNKTLRQTIRKRSQNKRLKELLKRNEKLQQQLQILSKKRTDATHTAEELKQETARLKRELLEVKGWYRDTKKKLHQLRGKHEDLRENNNSLAERLNVKIREIKRRERQITAREREIRLREAEAMRKEKQVSSLQQQITQKDERSLFGIKLRYQRIVFLFDRSGSIVQNQWKQVIIETCKEILQHCEVDEFAIVAFSSQMDFFPGRRGLMLAGSKQNKHRAIHWLSRKVRFGGHTHLHEALQIAYEDYGRLDAIFLLTDGLPSTRTRSTESLDREIRNYISRQVKNKINTKIITIAIGYPPAQARQYADIYKYLHKISQITGGQYLGR